jgi:phenylpropionate dioxygenase-like ring-hydroxylating dioxygenase large terminal subunit
VRGFHNVCRHRASRILDGSRGNCGHRMVCPYHAWSYRLDGALQPPPRWQGFEDLDLGRHGLAPLELEVFLGFVFVRLEPGLPSVAEMMGPYAAELAPYRFEDLVPQGRVTLRPRAVNWKNVGDNYADGLHITVGHPGLARLFGQGYQIEAQPWVDKMSGALQAAPSANWSERRYQALLPEQAHLPPERRRLWAYYKLWPNLAFDVYPDQIDFMQFIPVSATQTLSREIAYVRPDPSRAMRAARYLNWRINRRVSLEDKALIERVQEGMGGSSYVSGPLSRHEVCLRSFAQKLKRFIPEAALDQPPAAWPPTPEPVRLQAAQ